MHSRVLLLPAMIPRAVIGIVAAAPRFCSQTQRGVDWARAVFNVGLVPKVFLDFVSARGQEHEITHFVRSFLLR